MNKPAIPKNFYFLIVNTVITGITNMTVWFALIFFVYLQTEAVLATAVASGFYLVAVATTSIWFGNLVDHHRKKQMMLLSSFISLVIFSLSFVVYQLVTPDGFTELSNPLLWVFMVLVLLGVVAGNIRNIALPTVVTLMVAEEDRDKANGLVGTATGVAFLVVSVISAFLVGHSGMYFVFVLAIALTLLAMLHLWTIPIPEREIVHLQAEGTATGLDLRATYNAVKAVPGLLSLILFTTFNNFLGGVFMSLMDAYGLSLVSVQVWGLLWGFLSTAFILGGLIIAKVGLGKNPLSALFAANITIWVISTIFTVQPWIALLVAGMFIYLCVVPFIEAAEHTIIQKVVPLERQGRVFGFAQSVEQAASPLTAFLIGPIAQFIFIPFMTDGAGVELIGDWFGTGPDRGIALVFTLTGVIGLLVTLAARQSRFYKQLSAAYAK